MKRYLTLILSVVGLATYAQTIDNLELLNVRELQGSARYQALGGAFTALGNDPSAIHLNPAAAPVYRFDQLSLSLGFQGTSGDYLLIENQNTANNFNVNIENLGMVRDFNIGSGDWSNLSFGLTFSKLANFNRDYTISTSNSGTPLVEYWLDGVYGLTPNQALEGGFFDEYAAYEAAILDPENTGILDTTAIGNYGASNNLNYDRNARGSLNEFAATFGGQYKEKFYYGISVGIPILNYGVEDEIVENGFQPNAYPYDATGYSLFRTDYLSGSGFNLKLGIIARPVNWLRIGMAYETPTWYTINQIYETEVTGIYGSETIRSQTSSTGNFSYKVQTPSVYRPGIAFVFGQKGLISVDYEFTDASNTSAYVGNNSLNVNEDELSLSTAEFTSVTTSAQAIKVGGEYRMGAFSLRAGYHYRKSFYETPENFRGDYIAYSGGLGYRNKNFGVDLTMVSSSYNRQDFVHPYLFTNETGDQMVDGIISRFNVITGFSIRF